MRSSYLRLSAGVAVALVAAGLSPLGGSRPALATTGCAPSGADIVCTWDAPTTAAWQVPADVTQVIIDALGGQGGGTDGTNTGGLGGEATLTKTVVPGSFLQVSVAGAGGTGATGGAGGYGGRNDARGGDGMGGDSVGIGGGGRQLRGPGRRLRGEQRLRY